MCMHDDRRCKFSIIFNMILNIQVVSYFLGFYFVSIICLFVYLLMVVASPVSLSGDGKLSLCTCIHFMDVVPKKQYWIDNLPEFWPL